MPKISINQLIKKNKNLNFINKLHNSGHKI